MFFKITLPNKKTFVVVSKRSWVELIKLFDDMSNREEIYITQLSLWEFIKYIIGKE